MYPLLSTFSLVYLSACRAGCVCITALSVKSSQPVDNNAALKICVYPEDLQKPYVVAANYKSQLQWGLQDQLQTRLLHE